MQLISPLRQSLTSKSSLISTPKISALLIAAIAASVQLGSPAFSDTYEYTGANLSLSNPATWFDLTTSSSTGTTPGSIDIAQWDANSQATGTLILGGTTSWLGMTIINAPSDIAIANDGNTFNIGSSGIDMSNAHSNLTINNSLNLVNSQTWNIAAGYLITATNAISGGVGLAKTGLGTLILSGTNTYTGNTSITGSEILDFTSSAAPAANIIGNTSLILNAGKLVMNGSSSTGNSQAFNFLTINTGASSIDLNPGAGQTASMTFAVAPNRIQGVNNATPGGTLRFGTTGTITIPNLLNRFLILDSGSNAFATYGLYDWAGTDANGNVTAVSYVTSLPLSSNNLDVTANLTLGTSSAGSVRFNNNSAPVTLTLTSQLTQGGILMTPNSVGATIGGSLGSIRPNHASNGEASFSIIQNSTAGDLTISVAITNAAASTPVGLIKSGVGNLVLTNANNSYSGQTFINEGSISINANGELGSPLSGSAITFSGGTLQTTANFGLYNGAPGTNNRAINLNIGGGTLQPSAGTTLTIPGVISGPGALTISKPGTVILSGNNTYTGNTNVLNGATLQLDSSAGSGTVSVGSADGTGIGTLKGSSSNIPNKVIINSGSTFFPGHAGIGNMTLNSLTVGSDGLNGDPLGGATLDFSLAKTGNVTSVNNQLSLAANGTFIINGTNSINLYASGSTSQNTNSGTFVLANLNGATTVGDPNTSFTVANAVPQIFYRFSFVAGNLQVKVINNPPPPVWAADVSGTWSNSDADAIYWVSPPENVAGQNIFFPGNLGATPVVVTLGDPGVGGSILFGTNGTANPTTYTINGSGANGITLNLGASNNGGITVGGGTNTINANVTLAGTGVAIGVNNDTAAHVTSILAIGGIIKDNGQHANVFVTGTGSVILSANNTYGGNTSIGTNTTLQLGNAGSSGNANTGHINNNGTLAFNHSTPVSLSNDISGTGGLTQIGTGDVTLTGNYTATGPISISAGNLTFSNTTNTRQDTGVVLKMSSLSISPAGILDVTDHDAIIGNTTLQTINDEILNGIGLGPGGAQLTSSTANASGNLFLIPIDAAANGITSWDNVPVTDPNSVIVKFTYFGDATLDGLVDGNDFSVIAGGFGSTTPGISNIEQSWLMGDVNLDGFVNGNDFSVVAGNFGSTILAAPPNNPISPTTVPEPASLALLAIGVGTLITRKRRILRR